MKHQVQLHSKNIKNKLKSNSGASLAETLVTIIIMSIVMMAIAGAATVVSRVYREVRVKADAQTLMSTTVLAISEDLYYARDYSDGSFYSEARGYAFKYTFKDKEQGYKGSPVLVRERTAAADSTTGTQTSYEKLYVVAPSTQTLGLYIKLKDGINYADGCYSFTAQVYTKDGTLMEEQDVTVRSVLYNPYESSGDSAQG